VLIPVAALGLLRAGAGSRFDGVQLDFCRDQQSRMRGYKLQTNRAPKSLSRQLVEMVPQLIGPAIALAILIALSAGWIPLPGVTSH